jgi:uncharacterized membrane protein
MNKEMFINELNQHLDKIPLDDRKEIIYDYEEHFEIGLSEGKTEEEISNSLGNPKSIAKELLLDYRVQQAEKDSNVVTMSRAVLAFIGLSFLNLIILFPPFMSIVGVLIGIWVTALVLTLSPIAALISGFFLSFDATFLSIILKSLVACGTGLIIIFCATYITKFFIEIVIKYLKYNLRLIKGGNTK